MKFIVTSYDDDQQQTFTDFVEASTSEEAKVIVSSAREYAIAVDASDIDELRGMAARLEQAVNVATSPFKLLMSFDEEDALAFGAPDELNAWADEGNIGVIESLRRRKVVDEALGEREDAQ